MATLQFAAGNSPGTSSANVVANYANGAGSSSSGSGVGPLTNNNFVAASAERSSTILSRRATAASMSNRNTNRYSVTALYSMAAEQDVEVEDDLARGELHETAIRIFHCSLASSVARVETQYFQLHSCAVNSPEAPARAKREDLSTIQEELCPRAGRPLPRQQDCSLNCKSHGGRRGESDVVRDSLVILILAMAVIPAVPSGSKAKWQAHSKKPNNPQALFLTIARLSSTETFFFSCNPSQGTSQPCVALSAYRRSIRSSKRSCSPSMETSTSHVRSTSC